MRLERFVKTMAPLAALVATAALGGCGGMNGFGSDGVPLADLDLGGTPPDGIALLGPDSVVVTDGPELAISVEGPAADRLRFTLEDGTLGVMRENRSWNDDAVAVVRVTMPPPSHLSLAGSGTITAASVSDTPDANIAGSGTLDLQSVAAGTMAVNIAGSGTLKAAGTADKLDLNLMGSGDAAMPGLKVGRASVNIAGSGDATFASDGEVEANIAGSGEVTVRGRARCKVNAVGSGRLVCEDEATSGGEAG